MSALDFLNSLTFRNKTLTAQQENVIISKFEEIGFKHICGEDRLLFVGLIEKFGYMVVRVDASYDEECNRVYMSAKAFLPLMSKRDQGTKYSDMCKNAIDKTEFINTMIKNGQCDQMSLHMADELFGDISFDFNGDNTRVFMRDISMTNIVEKINSELEYDLEQFRSDRLEESEAFTLTLISASSDDAFELAMQRHGMPGGWTDL